MFGVYPSVSASARIDLGWSVPPPAAQCAPSSHLALPVCRRLQSIGVSAVFAHPESLEKNVGQLIPRLCLDFPSTLVVMTPWARNADLRPSWSFRFGLLLLFIGVSTLFHVSRFLGETVGSLISRFLPRPTVDPGCLYTPGVAAVALAPSPWAVCSPSSFLGVSSLLASRIPSEKMFGDVHLYSWLGSRSIPVFSAPLAPLGFTLWCLCPPASVPCRRLLPSFRTGSSTPCGSFTAYRTASRAAPSRLSPLSQAFQPHSRSPRSCPQA